MNNVALNKTATSSSYVSPFVAAKAVDGTLTPLNRWLCDAMPCWLQVDLGAPYWIDRWIVKHMATVGWPSNYVMSDFNLQGSMDNSSWFTMDTVSGNSSSTNDRTIAPKQARYVKVNVTSGLRANKGVASIVDLQIIESDYNPYLANLTISNGTLSPSFNSKVFAYTDQVGNEVPSVTVTPTVQDSRATIKVNNVAVASGQPSQSIPLQPGDNTITVAVTNGPITQQYVITVTRQTPVYLSSLILKASGRNVILNPDFAKDKLNYTATVGSAVASVTVTPTAEKDTSTIKVNNIPVASGGTSDPISLNPVSTDITVAVTPGGGGSPTNYLITVTKSS